MPDYVVPALISSLVTCILFIAGLSYKGRQEKNTNGNGYVKWKDLTKHCAERDKTILEAINNLSQKFDEGIHQLHQKIDGVAFEHEHRLTELETVMNED